MVLPPRMYISFIPKFLIKWKRQAGRGKKRGPYTLDRRIDWIVSTTRTSPLRLAFRNRLIRYPIIPLLTMPWMRIVVSLYLRLISKTVHTGFLSFLFLSFKRAARAATEQLHLTGAPTPAPGHED